MKDYERQLDVILSTTGEKLLQGAGRVSHDKALAKAKQEYQKYIVQNLSPVEQEYLKVLRQAEKDAKGARIED